MQTEERDAEDEARLAAEEAAAGSKRGGLFGSKKKRRKKPPSREGGGTPRVRVRFHKIRNARIKTVCKSQSCMVSQ